MILVVGSTGMVGREVCRKLVTHGERVRALVRETSDPGKVAALRELGVELVTGDLRDPASLDRACAGVASVMTTVSAMPFSYEAGVNDIRTTDLEGTMALIAAAVRANVQRFVYLSFSRNLDTPCPLHDAKRSVEARLRVSGLGWTILRPSCFMEVWLSPAVGFDAANAKATIYGEGVRPLSWISATDVAEFATRVLVSGKAFGTLELGGPQPLTPLEVVRIFERVGGRPFEIRHVAEDALRAQLATATDPMQQSFTALMCSYAKGDAIDMTEPLARFPIELTSVETYATRQLARTPQPVG